MTAWNSIRHNPTTNLLFLVLVCSIRSTIVGALATMPTHHPAAAPSLTPPITAAPTKDTTSPTTTKPSMSFYQRKLPDTCVAFASRHGKRIFRSALLQNGLKSFYSLIEQFHTQTEPAYCGVSTLVMVLNALAVDPGQHWKGPWRWYEERMLNCCLDLEEVKETGITMRDFQCLALCQGLSVDLTYCDANGNGDGNNGESFSGLDSFRKAVEAACVEAPATSSSSSSSSEDDFDAQQYDENDPLQVMVISYSRKILKQTGSGHFSPVAAYDRASDSVLILDTARFKYGAHWTKLPLVYEAMKPIDPDTGRSRGYALLSFVPRTPMQQGGSIVKETPAT
jgi:glutathione gamma-glutamylcysteinyltransferase